MLTGNPEIDEDHTMLDSALHKLMDPDIYASVIARVGVIEQFLSYTIQHLDREERLMRSIDFPEYFSHRDDHRRLQDSFLEIVKSAFKGTIPHAEICESMQSIFGEHTHTHDAYLAEWISKSKQTPRRRAS